MPTYIITTPEGKELEITAPDGATKDDALAYAQANYKPSVNQQTQPAGLSRTDKVLSGMADPIHGGAQLLTKMLPKGVVDSGNQFNNWLADKTGLVARLPQGGVDQQVREREADYTARRTAEGEGGFDGYRAVGNIVSPANLAIASKLPVAASLAGRVGSGSLGGALTGLVAPTTTEGDYATEKAKQVGLGSAAGGLLPILTAGAGRLISPKASVNPDIAALRAAGVRPTFGQTLGGMTNNLEQKATSFPIVGHKIETARMAALDQFNNVAINRATAPIGVKVKGSGTEAIREAGDAISAAYTQVNQKLGGFKLDKQANAELQSLQAMAKSGLDGRERATVARYFQDYINNKKGFTSEAFIEFDSKIGSDIARFSKGDAYQQKVADALSEVQKIVLENAVRAKPEVAPAYKAAKLAYANLVRLEGASVAGKGRDGAFTPGQLMTAVRGADQSVRDRATARGTALMQDLAGTGIRVLGNTVPDSGTAGRALPFALGAAGGYFNLPATAGLLGAGYLGYTQPVQNFLTAAATQRPESAQAIAAALQQAAPRLSPAAGQIGLGLLNYP